MLFPTLFFSSLTFSTTIFATPICKRQAAPAAPAAPPHWFGVNLSGAEFGAQTLPGTYGTDFTFPTASSVDQLIADRFNIFRVNFILERLVPIALTDPLTNDYAKNLTNTINYITSKGAYAVVAPWNFGRYKGAAIEAAGFQTFWKNVATNFKGNDHVVFDTNNEYHDVEPASVLALNQAAINGIRTDAKETSQWIFAEGLGYDAWAWTTSGSDVLKGLNDPAGKLIYEMHQYLDSDYSGHHPECSANPTAEPGLQPADLGPARLKNATQWLKDNKKLGIIGEFAGGASSPDVLTACTAAVTGLLQNLKDNSDVWTGALWWNADPFTTDTTQSPFQFEPPGGAFPQGGIGYQNYLATFQKFI